MLFKNFTAQWESPALINPENDVVDFREFEEAGETIFMIDMDEELPPPVVIAKINYQGKSV